MEKEYKLESKSVFLKSLVFFIVSSLVATFFILLTYFIYLLSDSNHLFNKYNTIIQERLQESERAINKISKDPSVLAYSEGIEKKNQAAYAAFYRAKNEMDLDFDFYLVNAKTEILLSNQDTILKSYPDKFFALSQLSNSRPEKGFQLKAFQSKVPSQENYLMIYQAIQESDQIAYVVFLFHEKDFAFDEKTSLQFMITDYYNNKIVGSDAFGMKMPQYRYPILSSQVDRFFAQNMLIEDYPIKLHLFYSLSDIENSLKMMVAFTSLVSFMFFIFTKLYLRKVLEDNIYFSNLIRTAILEFSENNFDYRIPLETNLDTSSVYFLEKYNEVLDLMEETILKNKSINQLVFEAEKKLLHAQFSPHFIFNVLENIKYEIPIEAKVPQEMMISLAKIMRYSVYHHDEFISMHEDIAYIQEYLKLQKYRYEERLDYQLSVDEACKDVQIPKLLLQPLVENCMKHGFIDDQTLFIEVSIKKCNQNLRISVSDNGHGMTKQRCDDLNCLIQSIIQQKEHDIEVGIGIANTCQRLRLHYPQAFSMEIQSIEKERTDVIIVIKEACHDQNHRCRG